MKKILIFLLFISFNIHAAENENIEKFDEDAIVILNTENQATRRELNLKVEDLSDLSITATASEINQVCDGAGGTVTATNLDTLTDGSNADSLHSHASSPGFDSGWFSVSINNGYSTTHSLSSRPITIQVLFKQNSGDSNYNFMSCHVDNDDGANIIGCATWTNATTIKIWVEWIAVMNRWHNEAGTYQVSNLTSGHMRILAWR